MDVGCYLVSSQTTNKDDLKTIYISYIRSILEQSAVIWHSNLTLDNQIDIERVQKNACRIILGEKYTEYESALIKLQMDNLVERRDNLSLRFAINCTKNDKTKHLFPRRNKLHQFKTRNEKKYEELKARTGRLKKSTVPYLQKLLNKSNYTEHPEKQYK